MAAELEPLVEGGARVGGGPSLKDAGVARDVGMSRPGADERAAVAGQQPGPDGKAVAAAVRKLVAEASAAAVLPVAQLAPVAGEAVSHIHVGPMALAGEVAEPSRRRSTHASTRIDRTRRISS